MKPIKLLLLISLISYSCCSDSNLNQETTTNKLFAFKYDVECACEYNPKIVSLNLEDGKETELIPFEGIGSLYELTLSPFSNSLYGIEYTPNGAPLNLTSIYKINTVTGNMESQLLTEGFDYNGLMIFDNNTIFLHRAKEGTFNQIVKVNMNTGNEEVIANLPLFYGVTNNRRAFVYRRYTNEILGFNQGQYVIRINVDTGDYETIETQVGKDNILDSNENVYTILDQETEFQIIKLDLENNNNEIISSIDNSNLNLEVIDGIFMDNKLVLLLLENSYIFNIYEINLDDGTQTIKHLDNETFPYTYTLNIANNPN